jgi:hypothetical protein
MLPLEGKITTIPPQEASPAPAPSRPEPSAQGPSPLFIPRNRPAWRTLKPPGRLPDRFVKPRDLRGSFGRINVASTEATKAMAHPAEVRQTETASRTRLRALAKETLAELLQQEPTADQVEDALGLKE